MGDCIRKRAKMMCDTPEITNLFQGDFVRILDEKWEGEKPLRIKKLLVRSLERERVEGWVNASEVKIMDET